MKLRLENIGEPSKAFFEKIVREFPSTNFQIVTGQIDDLEVPVLRIASPSGNPVKNLDFFSTDNSGDVFEFAGWHLHVEDLHLHSADIAFDAFCEILDQIMKQKKGIQIEDSADGPSYSLVDVGDPRSRSLILWD